MQPCQKLVSCLLVKSRLGGFDQAIHGGDTSSQLGAIVAGLAWCVNADDGGSSSITSSIEQQPKVDRRGIGFSRNG